MITDPFRTDLGRDVFFNKYAHGPQDSWRNLAIRLVSDVCGTMGGKTNPILSQTERDQLVEYIDQMKFIPGGRYLYYAGRDLHAWNNCFLLRAEEDTREEWGNLIHRATNCLMLGGGIGVDYSRLRPAGRALRRTGGVSSGPLPLMQMVNEVGRNVMQGGSRRSAIYGSLLWSHEDIEQFLHVKDWHHNVIHDGYSVWDAKQDNFNYPAPLDQTNISINYDDEWLMDPEKHTNEIFLENVRQALMTGEPGFSFNFGPRVNETLRNACTEVTSEDDSDVCNLGSVNMANIESIEEFEDIVNLAAKFLICGTVRADLPYAKVRTIREKNRRLGLGLMGMHEWLLQRGERYEVTPELHKWLEVYRDESERGANEHADRLYLSHPVAYRAIAPTGTIGILAGTTTGIEPLFATSYKRRYLTDGTVWKYQYVIDPVAQGLKDKLGDSIETSDTAYSLSSEPERRIKFQADVQDYVDQSISSTINLPSWQEGDETEGRVRGFAELLASYAHRLRGFTCYPDGSRGGQPITAVPWAEAAENEGTIFEEAEACKGGVCGI